MATVDDLARDIVGSLNLSEAFLIAIRWIDNRYKEMVSRVRFRHLRQIGEVQIPATYTTGTVAATRDSTAVVGTSTLWETPMTAGPQEYWWIRIASAWYKIATLTDDTNLVLATAFSEDTVTANTHSAVKRYHALDANARWLGDAVLTRLRLPLGPPIPLEKLDRDAPGRILTGQYPRSWAQLGVDSNGYLLAEFYPYSANSEIVSYVFWDLPTALVLGSTIPAQIDPFMLKEGALIDAYRYLKSQARQRNEADIANSWRNDEFAQMTKWDRVIQLAKATDKGSDDTSFILSMYGPQQRGGDIRNAHDHVYNRWAYPS